MTEGIVSAAVNATLASYATRVLTADRRRELVPFVMAWASTRVKTTGLAVDTKIAQLEKRVEKLLEGMEVQVLETGRLVLKARGTDEETLTLLRLGSRWFYGSEEVTGVILAGVFGSNPA